MPWAQTRPTESSVREFVHPAANRFGGDTDTNYAITLTDPDWKNASTLEAVRVGNADVFVYSTTGATDATKLTTYLVQKLKGLPRS